MGKRAAEKTEEEIEAEAKAARKAAKKAKKAEAAAAEEAAAAAEEAEAAAAKAARKAAKKAKKTAAAVAEEEEAEEEAPPPKKKKEEAKKAEEEAPPPKKKKEEPKEEAPKAAAEDEEFKDQTYKCCDCSQDWVDTADDQQFRWDKGFAETPKRCKDCRWAKKVRMEGGDPTAKGKGKGKGNKELEVFVGGLPFSTTEDVLRKDFEECGEIANFRMPYNDEGNCRGIAFIEYATQEGVDKALKFNETEYGGRYLSVKMSGDDKGKGKGKDGKGKGKGNKEFELFIGGLPFAATEEQLKKDFAECGEIVNLRMPLNEEGNSRGIAFMELKDQEGVDKALKFHETDYGGRTLTVKKSGEGKGEKGDKGKGKGKKGKKGKAPSESFAKSSGCIVAGSGEKKVFDSDSE